MSNKRKNGKLLMIVLVIAVVMSVMAFASVHSAALDIDPSAVSSVEDFLFNEYDTSIRITSYRGSAPNVVIPSEINGKPVEGLGANVFRASGDQIIPAEEIKSLTLPTTVYYLSDDALEGLTGIETITVEQGSTHFKVGADGALYTRDGSTLYLVPKNQTGSFSIPRGVNIVWKYAFEGAKYSSITMDDTVTSIQEGAFFGAEMTSISLSPNITYLGQQSAFENCSNLVSIVIPDKVMVLNTRTFAGCSSLTSVTFGRNLNEVYSYAFLNTTSLKNAYFDKYVYYIADSAFNGSGLFTHDDAVIHGYAGTAAQTLATEHSVTFDELVDTSVEETFTYEDYNEDGVIITGYTGQVSDVVIPAVIDGHRVLAIRNYAFAWNQYIESVVISEGIGFIDGFAFKECWNLSSIVIPKSVEVISDGAFGQTGITYLEISEENENYHVIDHRALLTADGTKLIAFAGNDGVAAVIPNTVTTIGDSAFQCIHVSSVTIPGSVTTIGSYAFADTDITSLYIPANVINIREGAFSTNYRLQTITVDANNVRYVAIDNVLFEKNMQTGEAEVLLTPAYASLTSEYTIPDGVKRISRSAFSYCGNIETVIFPDSVENIGNCAFAGCENLRFILIPPSVTTIQNNAFDFDLDNTSDRTIFGEAGSAAQTFAENIGYAFCTYTNSDLHLYIESISMNGQTRLYIPYTITTPVGSNYYDGKTVHIRSVDLFDGIDDITIVGYFRVAHGTGLSDAYTMANQKNYVFKGIYGEDYQIDEEFAISDGIIRITGYTGNSEYLNIPYQIGGLRVRYIGANAFKDKNFLYYVSTPSLYGIEENAFNGCTSLYRIDIDHTNYISSQAFYDCRNLQYVIIPDGCCTIGNSAFRWCGQLSYVYIPASVSSIANYAFAGTPMRIQFEVNENSGYFKTVGRSLMSKDGTRLLKCTETGDVVVPDGVTRLDVGCFMYNSGITSVSLPSSIRNIYTFAFRGCQSLHSVTFAEGLEELAGSYIFYESMNLESVYLPASLRYIASDAFVNLHRFSGLDNVYTKIYVDENSPYFESIDGEQIYSKDGKKLVWVSLGIEVEGGVYNVREGVERIEARAFSRCQNLTTINIPESVKEIGTHAFEECLGLNDIYILGAELIEGSRADIFAQDRSVSSRLYRSIGDNEHGESVVTEGLRIHGYRNSFIRNYISRINEANPTFKFEFVPIDANVETSGDLAAEVPNGSFEGDVPEFFATANEAAHNKSHLNDQNAILDYTLSFANSEQPDKGIEIRIPVAVFEAAGGKSNNPKIYYVSPNGRSISNVKGKRDGDYYVFWTPHFSDYAVMDSAIEFDNRPNIVVGDADVKAGNQFSVPIDISCNTGIATLVFDISFDNDIMMFVSAEDGGLFTGYNCAQVSDNTYRFTLTSDTDVTANGTLVTLNFEVGKKVFDSKNFISVTVDENNCKNAAGENVSTYSEFGEVDVVYFGRIDGKQLALGTEISFYYYAILSPEQAGAKMRFTINNNSVIADGTPTNVTNEYVFKFEGVNPQCLGDNIKAELILGNTVLDELDNFSVLSYCKSLLSKTPAQHDYSQAKYDAMVKLIADLMEYGAQSQLYTGHKTSELVNADEVIAALNAKTVFEPIGADHSELSSSENDNVYFASAGVYFSNTNKLFFKFKADGVSENFCIEITDFRNVTKPYDLSDCVEEDGYYKIYTEEISALYLAFDGESYHTFRVTLKDNDEEIQHIDYNVASYVYSRQESSTVKANLAKALYNYGLSTIAFWNA